MAKTHVWRIKKEYFRQLRTGEKSLEVRVGYPQIKKVKRGDIITFENYSDNEFKVRRVTVYDSFRKMLETEGVDRVLPGMSFTGALRVLKGIYPQEREELGVYVFDLKFVAQEGEKTFLTASDLLKSGNNKSFSKLVAESYMLTDWISKDYPNHVDHFYSKYVPGIFEGEREIIACYIDGKIVATVSLKNDSEEKKISTFYVRPEFRRQGIATVLLEKCFAYLGTDKPLVTIADYKLEQFGGIIRRYGWVETQVLDEGYYNEHSREHVFNGVI